MKSYDSDIVGKKFTKTQVFEGVASILAGYNFLEKIDLDEKLSNMFIFRDDTNSIKQDIFHKFGVNITEEILFLTVRQLCDKIINFLPDVIPDNQEFNGDVVRFEKRLWTSRQIYGLIFCRLGRVMKRSIKSKETVADLYNDDVVVNSNGLKAKLDRQINHIESVFRIQIFPNMTVDDIAESALFSMVQSGRMLSANNQNLPDDEKLWRFLISLVPPKVFINDVSNIFSDVHIVRAQIAETKNFDDLKKLVFGSALQREKE